MSDTVQIVTAVCAMLTAIAVPVTGVVIVWLNNRAARDAKATALVTTAAVITTVAKTLPAQHEGRPARVRTDLGLQASLARLKADVTGAAADLEAAAAAERALAEFEAGQG